VDILSYLKNKYFYRNLVGSKLKAKHTLQESIVKDLTLYLASNSGKITASHFEIHSD